MPALLSVVAPLSPAQGQVAAKVWIPALVIFVLAAVLPLPLHHLRLRVIARNRARAAMAVATMQRQEQLKGVEEAHGQGEGGARRRSFWGATWAYTVRAWAWLEPVLEVVEPRLCVVIYWTDVVSDFVFVTGYKGWSRQPAPAITVLFIILGNMVRVLRGQGRRRQDTAGRVLLRWRLETALRILVAVRTACATCKSLDAEHAVV